ncbi:14647_t:CDS:10 [Acaulospora colombiana]|uniref:14647_t:CDS:1 n=1 Tax=Acaulospora colombiana TaxID=27376 RepID=A0ACA9K513_9GLOM|nr:14647_t:CDS:10 [Acaulospora colombiana]
MPLNYKKICIAQYDYSAQDIEEISFKEDDVLYILENDDDEWWKAKLKIAKEEDEEGPVGVVPSNYIKEAEYSAVLKAIYDYNAQSDEELTFKEDDVLYLYDKDDPDWYLVKHNDVFGFVPAPYVEEVSSDEDESQSNKQQKSLFDAISVAYFFSISLGLKSASEPNGAYVDPLQAYARKVAHQKTGGSFEVKTWSVAEYSAGDKKKKKKKGTLSIGGDKVYYASESDKTPVQQWSISDLSDIKHEKKRVLISFGGEKAAKFDFHTSKGDAEAIYNKVQESMASLELPTVKLETPSRPSSHQMHEEDEVPYEETQEEEQEPDVEDETEEINEDDLPPPKSGVALYYFKAQGEDEITIYEGDRLWVIDDVSSQDWWKIRKGDEEGVVPSTYVKIGEENTEVADDSAELSSKLEEQRRSKLEEERQRKEEERLRREEERLRKEEERLRKEEEKLRKEEERRKREENERKRRDEERRLQEEKKQKQVSLAPTPPALPNRTGAFKVEAQFLQYIDGKVHLHKINGVKIAVPVERMSKKDLAYLEEVTGEKFDDKTDDIPLAAIAAAHKGKATLTNSRKADYDWYDFFLKADIAHQDAFEYAKSFIEEKLDESTIPDLDDELMKGLGVRVGDIIRIKRYISEKYNPPKKRNVSFGTTSIIPDKETEENDHAYAVKIQNEEIHRRMQEKRDEQIARELQEEENRKARSEGRTIPKAADLYSNLDSIIQKDDKKTPPKNASSLFSEDNGVLKNNTKKTRPSPSKTAPIQIDSSNLMISKEKLDDAFKPSTSSTKPTTDKFEDDAWVTSSDSTPVLNSQVVKSNPPALPQSRQLPVAPSMNNNRFDANFNQNQLPPLNPLQLQQNTPQTSVFDPKVVFASMKSGQIGPNIPPKNMSGINDDKYSAFKQVDPKGPSVFDNPTPNQLSGYNVGSNPGGLNTSWNQTGTGGYTALVYYLTLVMAQVYSLTLIMALVYSLTLAMALALVYSLTLVMALVYSLTLVMALVYSLTLVMALVYFLALVMDRGHNPSPLLYSPTSALGNSLPISKVSILQDLTTCNKINR